MGPDPQIGDEPGVEVAVVQPYQAVKQYVCPGCNNVIEPGVGHLVVIPDDGPDLRRHWHKPCWQYRRRRRPGR